MDFSVFPCRQKKKPVPPPPPAPAPPPPPKPKAPTLPEFMQQIPRVPGSRNVEMLFRWNMDYPGMGGGYPGYNYGPPNAGPFGGVPPPMHRHMALPGPHLQGGGGMHGAIQPFGQPFGQGMMQPFGQPFGGGQGMYGAMQPFGQPFSGQGMQPFGQPFGMHPYDQGMGGPFGQVHMDGGYGPFGHF